jgi:hypothetical protein
LTALRSGHSTDVILDELSLSREPKNTAAIDQLHGRVRERDGLSAIGARVVRIDVDSELT